LDKHAAERFARARQRERRGRLEQAELGDEFDD
jgi:hypothetical protein